MKIDLQFQLESRPWLVSVTAFLVLGVVFYGVFFKPLLLSKSVLAKKMVFEKKRAEYATIFAGFAGGLKKQSQTFMDADNAAALIGPVNEIARQSGVNLLSVTPRESERSEDVVKLTIELECAAHMHALGRFVAAVENHNPYLKIEEIEIQAEQTGFSEDHLGQAATAVEGIGRVRVQITSYKVLIDV